MISGRIGIITGILVVFCAGACGEVFLPGMQPKESGIEFAKVQQCKMCHAKTKNGSADPFFSWQSSMMALAARDVVFRASTTIANQDIPGVGEFCFRCHAPRGWLEDRSKPVDGSALNEEDMFGVSCDVCHKFVDPMGDRANELVQDVPPSYGNAMMVADPANVVRGPYGDGKGAMPHQTMKSKFHASSQLCGTCHNISNPIFAEDVKTQPVHAFGHVERTYSEWLLSDYAKQGADGTCQSCHYRQVDGGGQASRFGSQQREYFVMHGPAGGSTWVQDATYMVWDGEGMDKKALELGKARSLAMLKDAAKLEVTRPSKSEVNIRITNLTGHKLPTGYPEGRRMWLNVRFLNAGDEIIGEIGRYGTKKDTLFGRAVEVPALLDADTAVVYEAKPGMSAEQARKFGKEPGPSFHFVLNDIMCKDTRIPPKGFDNAAFAEHLSKPVGIDYADGQYWHDVKLDIPDDTAKVEVRLMYQSVIWEYIKFLAEENKTDDWGKRLLEAWKETSKCAPTVMAEEKLSLDG